MEVYLLKVSRFSFKNYCYLIVDTATRDAVLIDPAWEMDKIENQLSLSQAKLKAVLLTHHHPDHIHLAEAFALKYQVPVRMSKIEIDYYDFSCRNLVSVDPVEPFMYGALKITPLLTPGHTKGALCYWIGEALFSGDTLFTEGCGMCSEPGGDPYAMFDSLSYLKSVLPGETLIYPGHSYGKTPGEKFSYLRETNIYLQFTEREDFVSFRMRPYQKGLMAFR